MSKFKVGDRVISIIDDKIGNIKKGDKGTVVEESDVPHINFDNNIREIYAMCENELKLIKQKKFRKSDLKDRYVVKTREGYEYIVDLKGNKILKLDNGVQLDTYLYLKSYNNDLTYSNFICYCFDIIEIYKPEYKTIWTRPEEVKPEPKELTVDEISKLLGYDIKIKEIQ